MFYKRISKGDMKIMNIEHYRNFIKIVESGTISAAAKKLMIAQPALSNQLKAMEEALGTELLIRGARNVRLTDAGKIFFERIHNIIILQDKIEKEIKECSLGNSGTLWLGMSAAMPDHRITKLLLNFNKLFPNVTYEIFETNADQLIELLKDNIIEVAILRKQAYDYPFTKSVVTIDEKLMAVYARNNPWLEKDMSIIPISKLKNVPISVTKGIKKSVTNACLGAGFEPKYINVSTSRVSSIIWAKDGRAVAISAGHLDYQSKDLCCRPIDSDAMSITRSIIYLEGRGLSLIAKAFLDFSKEVFVEDINIY